MPNTADYSQSKWWEAGERAVRPSARPQMWRREVGVFTESVKCWRLAGTGQRDKEREKATAGPVAAGACRPGSSPVEAGPGSVVRNLHPPAGPRHLVQRENDGYKPTVFPPPLRTKLWSSRGLAFQLVEALADRVCGLLKVQRRTLADLIAPGEGGAYRRRGVTCRPPRHFGWPRMVPDRLARPVEKGIHSYWGKMVREKGKRMLTAFALSVVAS